MVLFNYATKELTAKVVYYGPGLCGKTTNLQHIYDTLPGNAKGKMLSLATKTDRTLFFDFLPIDLGTIRGMKTKIQLYTVPGQVFYDTTRKLVLKGADGVVFVADSQEAMLDANLDSFDNLVTNLREQNLDIENMPHVIQFNKRDMKNVLSMDELNRKINRHGVPSFEAIAPKGDGVFDTLKGISKLVLKNLGQRYGLETDNAAKKKVPKTPLPKPPSALAPKPAPEPPKPAPPPAEPKPVPPPVAAPKPPAPKPPAPKPPAPKPAPTPSKAEAAAKINPSDPHMDEIEFIEDDTIEKADVLADKVELDFEEPPVDLDDDVLDDDAFDDDPLVSDLEESVGDFEVPGDFDEPIEDFDEPVDDFDESLDEEEDLKPLPNLDDSEVIELENESPIEMDDDLDDMAEIANMASNAPPLTRPREVQQSDNVEPIEVPVSINLPAALGGQPLRLQINITFED